MCVHVFCFVFPSLLKEVFFLRKNVFCKVQSLKIQIFGVGNEVYLLFLFCLYFLFFCFQLLLFHFFFCPLNFFLLCIIMQYRSSLKKDTNQHIFANISSICSLLNAISLFRMKNTR